MGEHYQDSLIQHIVRWIVEIATVIALAWVCVYAFGTQTVNAGQSMRTTLEDGDRLLLDRVTPKLFGSGRFDVVLFQSPSGSAVSIKRIVGLPGEAVQIQHGALLINGEPLQLPEGLDAAVSIAGEAEEPVLLGEDEYFVLSDNREAGEDSRFGSVGSVPIEAITGRVWFRIAPLGKIGLIK